MYIKCIKLQEQIFFCRAMKSQENCNRDESLISLKQDVEKILPKN